MSDDKTDPIVDDIKKDEPPKDDKKPADIPYSRFKEVNEKNKNIEAELNKAKADLQTFQDAEKKKKEAKLLEDKKYDELLKAKELEIEGHKTEMEGLKKNASLEKIKSKIVNLANKEGAVDAEDILRFISTEDLLELDSEKLAEEVKSRIDKIKENKAHLFTNSQRDNRENGQPYSANTSGNILKKDMTRDQQIEDALRRSHKR